jgi:hypothetical protein
VEGTNAGTQPWTSKDVILDEPDDATSISFGILLSGTGEVWMNPLTFEAVSKETETTGAKSPLSSSPVNLSFTEYWPQRGWENRSEFEGCSLTSSPRSTEDRLRLLVFFRGLAMDLRLRKVGAGGGDKSPPTPKEGHIQVVASGKRLHAHPDP